MEERGDGEGITLDRGYLAASYYMIGVCPIIIGYLFAFALSSAP